MKSIIRKRLSHHIFIKEAETLIKSCPTWPLLQKIFISEEFEDKKSQCRDDLQDEEDDTDGDNVDAEEEMEDVEEEVSTPMGSLTSTLTPLRGEAFLLRT